MILSISTIYSFGVANVLSIDEPFTADSTTVLAARTCSVLHSVDELQFAPESSRLFIGLPGAESNLVL